MRRGAWVLGVSRVGAMTGARAGFWITTLCGAGSTARAAETDREADDDDQDADDENGFDAHAATLVPKRAARHRADRAAQRSANHGDCAALKRAAKVRITDFVPWTGGKRAR